jgi:hypothetical protein
MFSAQTVLQIPAQLSPENVNQSSTGEPSDATAPPGATAQRIAPRRSSDPFKVDQALSPLTALPTGDKKTGPPPARRSRASPWIGIKNAQASEPGLRRPSHRPPARTIQVRETRNNSCG